LALPAGIIIYLNKNQVCHNFLRKNISVNVIYNIKKILTISLLENSHIYDGK
jgi:hypothetical protein